MLANIENIVAKFAKINKPIRFAKESELLDELFNGVDMEKAPSINPKDWSVYADWLEENGREHLAEVIRRADTNKFNHNLMNYQPGTNSAWYFEKTKENQGKSKFRSAIHPGGIIVSVPHPTKPIAGNFLVHYEDEKEANKKLHDLIEEDKRHKESQQMSKLGKPVRFAKESELLDSIKDDPYNVELHNVLADHLEEKGKEAIANHIRRAVNTKHYIGNIGVSRNPVNHENNGNGWIKHSEPLGNGTHIVYDALYQPNEEKEAENNLNKEGRYYPELERLKKHGITLHQGDYGTFELHHANGDSRSINSDWDYPSVASTFGWKPCEECDRTDGTIDCEHHTASEMINDAQDYLADHVGETVEDPGYFEQMSRSGKPIRFIKLEDMLNESVNHPDGKEDYEDWNTGKELQALNPKTHLKLADWLEEQGKEHIANHIRRSAESSMGEPIFSEQKRPRSDISDYEIRDVLDSSHRKSGKASLVFSLPFGGKHIYWEAPYNTVKQAENMLKKMMRENPSSSEQLSKSGKPIRFMKFTDLLHEAQPTSSNNIDKYHADMIGDWLEENDKPILASYFRSEILPFSTSTGDQDDVVWRATKGDWGIPQAGSYPRHWFSAVTVPHNGKFLKLAKFHPTDTEARKHQYQAQVELHELGLADHPEERKKKKQKEINEWRARQGMNPLSKQTDNLVYKFAKILPNKFIKLDDFIKEITKGKADGDELDPREHMQFADWLEENGKEHTANYIRRIADRHSADPASPYGSWISVSPKENNNVLKSLYVVHQFKIPDSKLYVTYQSRYPKDEADEVKKKLASEWKKPEQLQRYKFSESSDYAKLPPTNFDPARQNNIKTNPINPKRQQHGLGGLFGAEQLSTRHMDLFQLGNHLKKKGVVAIDPTVKQHVGLLDIARRNPEYHVSTVNADGTPVMHFVSFHPETSKNLALQHKELAELAHKAAGNLGFHGMSDQLGKEIWNHPSNTELKTQADDIVNSMRKTMGHDVQAGNRLPKTGLVLSREGKVNKFIKLEDMLGEAINSVGINGELYKDKLNSLADWLEENGKEHTANHIRKSIDDDSGKGEEVFVLHNTTRNRVSGLNRREKQGIQLALYHPEKTASIYFNAYYPEWTGAVHPEKAQKILNMQKELGIHKPREQMQRANKFIKLEDLSNEIAIGKYDPNKSHKLADWLEENGKDHTANYIRKAIKEGNYYNSNNSWDQGIEKPITDSDKWSIHLKIPHNNGVHVFTLDRGDLNFEQVIQLKKNINNEWKTLSEPEPEQLSKSGKANIFAKAGELTNAHPPFPDRHEQYAARPLAIYHIPEKGLIEHGYQKHVGGIIPVNPKSPLIGYHNTIGDHNFVALVDPTTNEFHHLGEVVKTQGGYNSHLLGDPRLSKEENISNFGTHASVVDALKHGYVNGENSRIQGSEPEPNHIAHQIGVELAKRDWDTKTPGSSVPVNFSDQVSYLSSQLKNKDKSPKQGLVDWFNNIGKPATARHLAQGLATHKVSPFYDMSGKYETIEHGGDGKYHVSFSLPSKNAAGTHLTIVSKHDKVEDAQKLLDELKNEWGGSSEKMQRANKFIKLTDMLSDIISSSSASNKKCPHGKFVTDEYKNNQYADWLEENGLPLIADHIRSSMSGNGENRSFIAENNILSEPYIFRMLYHHIVRFSHPYKNDAVVWDVGYPSYALAHEKIINLYNEHKKLKSVLKDHVKMSRSDVDEPQHELSNGYSWLAPTGEFHPVKLYGHDEFARKLGSKSSTLFNEGWQRIARFHKTDPELHAENFKGHKPNSRQMRALRDFAIEEGHDSLIHFDGNHHTVLWERGPEKLSRWNRVKFAKEKDLLKDIIENSRIIYNDPWVDTKHFGDLDAKKHMLLADWLEEQGKEHLANHIRHAAEHGLQNEENTWGDLLTQSSEHANNFWHGIWKSKPNNVSFTVPYKKNEYVMWNSTYKDPEEAKQVWENLKKENPGDPSEHNEDMTQQIPYGENKTRSSGMSKSVDKLVNKFKALSHGSTR